MEKETIDPQDLVDLTDSNVVLRCLKTHIVGIHDLPSGRITKYCYERGEIKERKWIKGYNPDNWVLQAIDIETHRCEDLKYPSIPFHP